MNWTRFDGIFAERDTAADRIHAGRNVAGLLEDEMDEWWPSLDRLSFDSYDNSMEIYFEDQVNDLEPTPEQLTRIWEFGFDRCWLNFKGGKHNGGSERAYTSPALRARIA